MPRFLEAHLLAERGGGRPSASRQKPTGPILAPNAVSVRHLQQAAGNAAVQRLLTDAVQRKPKEPGQVDKEQEEELPVQSLQRQAAGTLALQRVTTAWELTEPAPIRSNTDSSTTSGENPTFTGSVTKNDKKKKWGYQLDKVEAKGKIQIVYYTADHYPAPVPEDDSGALSNVTSANWKAIVKDLKKNRTGIGGAWSAYLAENTHEKYHWKNEWQKLVRAAVQTADKKVKALSLSFDGAAAETDAEKDLQPKAATIFNTQINAARKKWNAMGDSPGDPPYKAQAASVDHVAKRVADHAKAQKWK